MKIGLLLALTVFAGAVPAEQNLLMARSSSGFEVTIEVAKESLAAHGYTVMHEQRCDGGLKGMGYKTDFYRVLFFGKSHEVRDLSLKYPELIPFLPLKLAVYAEGDQTLVAIFNPQEMAPLFGSPEITLQFSRWKSDLVSILADIRSYHQ